MKLSNLFSNLKNMIGGWGGKTLVGLSIGTSAVKLVELQKIGKSWKLLHFGIVQLPEDVIVNREIVNSLMVTESIKTLISQIKLKNNLVCTSLSGTSLIIRRMTLEVPNLRELQDQVFWEAEQYLPFDVSEVIMDYHLLSRKDSKTDLLFVAVKRSVLDSYINCIEEAGLKVKIVDTDFFALQNLFETSYTTHSSEAVGIVDIGASSMKTVVVQAGVPIFTKDSALGGRNLTAEIQKNLNLSYVDAETLKVSGEQGGSTPQEVSELIRLMADNFALEIKKAFDYYNASAIGAPISYVLLTGGSSKLPELTKTIEESLGLPTQLMNSFNVISYDPEIFNQEYLNNIGPIASIPIGLAIRAGVN